MKYKLYEFTSRAFESILNMIRIESVQYVAKNRSINTRIDKVTYTEENEGEFFFEGKDSIITTYMSDYTTVELANGLMFESKDGYLYVFFRNNGDADNFIDRLIKAGYIN